MRLSPSPFTVASCLGLRPMMLFTRVILSVFPGTDDLRGRDVAVARPLARSVHVLEVLDPPERIDGGLQDVVRVVRAERLGEDVLHAGRFQHGPDGAAGDDPGARYRRLEEYTTRAEVAGDLDRNRGVPQRDEDEVLLRVLDGLADGFRHLVR